jgi:hypothetical protein
MQDERLARQHQLNESDVHRAVHMPDSDGTTSPDPCTIYSIKKLSYEEMQKRHEKGLCFNCNERYTSEYKWQSNKHKPWGRGSS